MSTQAETIPRTTASPWIYGPWLDLIVGCGAWSAPLLLISAVLQDSRTHAWAVTFYALAFVFNYPHFMATVYRAYHTREEFQRYRIFTVHITLLLVLTAVVLHGWFRLVPWIFTLYICWSPWHYTGQNFGLLMMFVRRSGAAVDAVERRLLQLAFVASYVMLLVGFETDASSDPLILSLGLPSKASLAARLLLGAAFLILGMLVFARLVRRSGPRTALAPGLLFLSQFLWFVLPTLVELYSKGQIPQTRYSSGVLAILHSTQYLWITSYYAQREAKAAGNSGWRMWSYFGTLFAGGVALFVPAPWIVSAVFHYDFTTSFLIFTALVNIHHFILDGAIWKLRDSRIASLLIDRGGRAATAAAEKASVAGSATRRVIGRAVFSRPVRITLAMLFLLWGAVDLARFSFGTWEGNLPELLRAANLTPYDSSLQMRIARAEMKTGQLDQAVEALTRAVEANPGNPGPQNARGQALLEGRRYTEAYEHYKKMVGRFPRDPDALVNFGVLANQQGNAAEATEAWEKATEVDPQQANAHLYLAETLDKKGQPAAAARHYVAFLRAAAAQPESTRPPNVEIVSATIQLGDDDSRINLAPEALRAYQAGVTLAQKSGDAHLESLALAHLADAQEKSGDVAGAAHSYQRGLALDPKTEDSGSEGADWFDYGQFLRRQGQPEELAYACFVRAEDLLTSTPGDELETVRRIRRDAETKLGRKSADARKNLRGLLQQAVALPESSFLRHS
ncbi:MAG: tetratricopeptide repeat protein [Candidatus Acidiferrales bacterium]